MSKEFLHCTFPDCPRGNAFPCTAAESADSELDCIFAALPGDYVCPERANLMRPIQCDQDRITSDIELLKTYTDGVSFGRSEVGGISGNFVSGILPAVLAATDTQRKYDLINTFCFGLAVGASTADTRYKISQIQVNVGPIIIKDGEVL